MATGSAVLEREISAEMPPLRLVPSWTGKSSRLQLEYQYVRISHDEYAVPWLDFPVRGGQTWHFLDDGKHANPVSGELKITFDSGTIPIIVIDRRACESIEEFLREVLDGTAWYVKG